MNRDFVYRFNKYLCCCLPRRSRRICRTETTDSSDRNSNRGINFSQRRRVGRQDTLNETSFGSTFRRHTQELNSTALYELPSEETTRPT